MLHPICFHQTKDSGEDANDHQSMLSFHNAGQALHSFRSAVLCQKLLICLQIRLQQHGSIFT